jgi:hypothetical protein
MKKILMIGTVVMLLAGQAFAEEEGFWTKMSKGHNGGANAGGGVVGAAIVIGTLGVRAVAYSLSKSEDINKSIEPEEVVKPVESAELITIRSRQLNTFHALSKSVEKYEENNMLLWKESNEEKKVILDEKAVKLETDMLEKRIANDAAANEVKKYLDSQKK